MAAERLLIGITVTMLCPLLRLKFQSCSLQNRNQFLALLKRLLFQGSRNFLFILLLSLSDPQMSFTFHGNEGKETSAFHIFMKIVQCVQDHW